MTIRQRLHRRLLRRYRPIELSILAAGWGLTKWQWMDRYCDWSVRTFGEKAGEQPWWDRALGRFICWLMDWRTTISLWFGRNEVSR